MSRCAGWVIIESVVLARAQVEEYADEVFDLLDNGAHIYFCGLKGMMPGALTAPLLCNVPTLAHRHQIVGRSLARLKLSR